MQPGSRPSGRERPIRVADVEGSSPASTVLDSGIEGKSALPIWSSKIRHQPGMEGTAAREAVHTLSLIRSGSRTNAAMRSPAFGPADDSGQRASVRRPRRVYAVSFGPDVARSNLTLPHL